MNSYESDGSPLNFVGQKDILQLTAPKYTRSDLFEC